MKKLLYVAAAIGLLAAPAVALADTGTYGATTVVNTGPASDPTVFQLTSDPNGLDYAGLYIGFAGAITLSDITQLSADYQMTIGTVGGGAPRFSIIDTTNNALNEAYVYFGTPLGGGGFSDPNNGAWANTGNYADSGSADLRVQVNGFGGDSTGQNFETWSDFVANDGGVAIGYVTLDLDAGYSSPGQQMLADNFTVNNTVLTAGGGVPEPASWALLILGFGGAGAMLRNRRKALAA